MEATGSCHGASPRRRREALRQTRQSKDGRRMSTPGNHARGTSRPDRYALPRKTPNGDRGSVRPLGSGTKLRGLLTPALVALVLALLHSTAVGKLLDPSQVPAVQDLLDSTGYSTIDAAKTDCDDLRLPNGDNPDFVLSCSGTFPKSLVVEGANMVSFPTSISSLTKLNSLTLFRTAVQTTLPQELGLLKSLIKLDVRECRMFTELPVSLGNLTRLTSLTVSSSNIVGIIPTTLGVLSKLANLDLSMNRLSGTIPAELERLQQLQSLDFSKNYLGGPIPAFLQISRPLRLTTVDLYSNFFRGLVNNGCTSPVNASFENNCLSYKSPCNINAQRPSDECANFYKEPGSNFPERPIQRVQKKYFQPPIVPSKAKSPQKKKGPRKAGSPP